MNTTIRGPYKTAPLPKPPYAGAIEHFHVCQEIGLKLAESGNVISQCGSILLVGEAEKELKYIQRYIENALKVIALIKADQKEKLS